MDSQANRFADMLQISREKVEQLMSGHNGLTPFGSYLIEVLDLNSRRIEIVDRIVERQQDNEEEKRQNLAEGFRMRVSKRGRARL